MQRLQLSFAIAASLALSGCLSVPEEAVVLNDRVTSGIELLEENSLTILDAYEASLVAAIEDGFEQQFREAEALVRQRNNLGAEAALTDEQRLVAAALTYRIIDSAKSEARALIDARRANVRANAQRIQDSNASVSRFLRSQSLFASNRSALIDDLSNLSGLTLPDPSVLAARLLGQSTEEE